MQPIIVVWLLNNMSGHYKRAIGVVIQIYVGNCAGFTASNIFLPSQTLRYLVGYGVGLTLNTLTGFAGVALFFYMRHENWRRDAGERGMWYAGLTQDEKENLGDDHPEFRFTI